MPSAPAFASHPPFSHRSFVVFKFFLFICFHVMPFISADWMLISRSPVPSLLLAWYVSIISLPLASSLTIWFGRLNPTHSAVKYSTLPST